jgi:hypothetical protein
MAKQTKEKGFETASGQTRLPTSILSWAMPLNHQTLAKSL